MTDSCINLGSFYSSQKIHMMKTIWIEEQDMEIESID